MLIEFHNSKSLLHPKSHNLREHKTMVIGPRKVGKSALVVRFLTKRFISEYVENTDMPCIRIADVDGEPLKVNIHDTSDKAMKSNFVENHVKGADAIMMIYSITDKESFVQLKNMALTFVEKFKDDEKEQMHIPPFVLVGNKGDLDFLRQVPRHEGFELAERLHCDFFEASAREGWSKLISRSKLPSSCCSPTSDSDSISLFASATGTIGMVGLPNMKMSREFSHCLTPNPIRRRIPNKGCHSDNECCYETTNSVKRWGSSNCLNRIGASSSITNLFNGVTESKRSNFYSQTFSEDESDNDSSTAGLFRPRKKSSQHTSLISKLSPRLRRKFSKSIRATNENPDNRSKNKDVIKRGRSFRASRTEAIPNALSLGLSTTLLVSAKLGDALGASPTLGQTPNLSSSYGSSVNTSMSGSVDSLSPELADEENNNNVISPRKSIKNKLMTDLSEKVAPLLVETFAEAHLQENEFSSSEPFLCLFREKLSRTRIRSRSPTQMLMNGFKKIRSLADHHGNGVHKSCQINSNSQNLLAVPIIKF